MSVLVALAVAALSASLFFVVAATPAAPGLEAAVAAALPASGVENPVTGVLLDYRGYDTLLEVFIVALACAAAAALAPRAPGPAPLAGPVARGAAAVLAPAITLFAGYLLWAGSGQPGGAFQAGATLAGALILMDVAGDANPFWRRGAARRVWAGVGTLGFLVVGALTLALGRPFLDYPGPEAAYALILTIEAAATLSIAVCLAALFAAEPAEPPQ